MTKKLFDEQGFYTEYTYKLDAIVKDSLLEACKFSRESGLDIRHAEYVVIQAVMDAFLIDRLNHRFEDAKSR